MNTNKVLLFDFDGVIVDSLKDWHEVANEIGSEPVDLATFRSWHDGNIHEVDMDPKETENYTVVDDNPWTNNFRARLQKLSPIEAVHTLIPELAKRFSLYIITSATTPGVSAFLEQHKILDCFQKVLGADVHYSKTRKIRDLLEERGATSSDAVFVTDTLGDIREAAKAGVQSIAVTWGFHERVDLEKGSPFAIVDTAEELKLRIVDFFD